MRVIAGFLGGRQFKAPHGHRTHPMSDKLRGAIFGVLGDIKGLTVLDAFAGSGALAIEAVSRGAHQAIALEVDKAAHQCIEENIASLGISDKVKATRTFANAWSTRNQNQTFDLIMLDPPYNDIPYRDLKTLPRHLKPGGTIVLSWPGETSLPAFQGLRIVHSKRYGDAQLAFYQRIS